MGPAHTHGHNKHVRQFLRVELSYPSAGSHPRVPVEGEGATSKGRPSRPGVRLRDALCPGLRWAGGGEAWALGVCACVGCVYACMYLCVYICLCAYVCVYMCTYVRSYVGMCVYACVCVFLCVR